MLKNLKKRHYTHIRASPQTALEAKETTDQTLYIIINNVRAYIFI